MKVQTDLKAEKAKQLSIPSRHVFRVLLPIPMLVSLGFVGNMQGWIGSSENQATPASGLTMTIPDARVKDLPKDRKYDQAYGGNTLSKVNGIGITLDENSNMNSRMIGGEKRSATGIDENELTAVEELATEMGARNTTGTAVSARQLKQTSEQRKINAWNQANARQRVIGQQVGNSMDHMYRNPALSQSEEAEQTRLAREEEQRLRANEKLLELLDRQVQQQGQPVRYTPAAVRNSEQSAVDGKGQLVQKEYHKVQPHVRTVIATPDREPGNAFYGLNGSKIRRTRPEKIRGTIRAVVHGEGEGVSVTNGTPVALRMQEETQIRVGSEALILPENALVYGITRLNGDRVYITVSTIRLDNFLYPVRLEAFDLDGQKGLHVPDLKIKQQTANTLVQGSSQLVSPGYIVGGTVGQQVGGQLASQGIGAALNAGKNLLQRKTQQPRARIQPNYQILLRSASGAESEYEESTETTTTYE